MRALPITILAALAFAGSAQAQELDRASQQVVMRGDAPVACVANSARAGNASNAVWQDQGPNGGQVVITSLVDETTAAARPSAIQLSLPVVCNSSHRITLRSANGGLLRQGAMGNRNRPGGFSEFQAYDVAMQWQQQVVRLGGGTATASLAFAQPAKGDLVVDISVPRGTTPLVAGTYSDAVVVEIRPAN